MNNLLVVTAASTINLTSVNHNGLCLESSAPPVVLSLDGYVPQIGEWVLIKNQNDKTQDGIYQVDRQGILNPLTSYKLTRRDFAAKLKGDLLFYIKNGDAQKGDVWRITNDDNPITAGYTQLEFERIDLSTNLLQTDIIESKTTGEVCVNDKLVVDEIEGKTGGDIDIEGVNLSNGVINAVFCGDVEQNQITLNATISALEAYNVGNVNLPIGAKVGMIKIINVLNSDPLNIVGTTTSPITPSETATVGIPDSTGNDGPFGLTFVWLPSVSLGKNAWSLVSQSVPNNGVSITITP